MLVEGLFHLPRNLMKELDIDYQNNNQNQPPLREVLMPNFETLISSKFYYN